MKITKLTFLGFYLNGALGSGKYDEVSITEVKNQIEKGTIFKYLENTLGDDIDISAIDLKDRQELLEEWEDLANAVDERRKLGVDKNGLCLLVAYLLEGIQRRKETQKQ